MNSERPEHDGTKKTKGGHHSQHIEFQRQTHGDSLRAVSDIQMLPETKSPCKTKTSLHCSISLRIRFKSVIFCRATDQGPIARTIRAVMRRASGTARKATQEASGQATAKAFIHCPKKFEGKPRFMKVITAVISKAMKNAIVMGKMNRALPSMVPFRSCRIV